VNVTLVRSATVILELAGRRILVDPMLDPAGARPPVENTANPVRNPTVALPVPVENFLSGLDAVLVTHCHKDHLDDTAIRLVPRELPVFCRGRHTGWYEDVEETIERFRPRVAVVNAAGASFVVGELIVMGIEDVREVVSRVPVVVAVHLEALNHCPLTRAELAAAVPGVVIPRDGETVEV
jgi:glyoxylase-like metal-dependent hydrolase (beta-lactamase superfamily II)